MKHAHSSPASPVRTAPISPSCCSTRATWCTASSAARRRSTPAASTISIRIRMRANVRFVLHYGDMTDATNLIRLVQETQPDEIYNLAAQSHVQVSFETPEYTANADALGTLRLLEAIRILGLDEDARASIRPRPRSSTARCRKCRSARRRRSIRARPMRAAKLYAYWITVNYREAYGMHASNGILFNHEEPDARRNLRHAQDHARRRRDPARPAGQALSRQSRRQARLGPCARLCRGHVADAAAGRAGRLRAGDRRDAFGARVRRERLRPGRHARSTGGARASTRRASTPRPGRSWSRSIRAISARPRSTS